jgi:hypothetical protein
MLNLLKKILKPIVKEVLICTITEFKKKNPEELKELTKKTLIESNKLLKYTINIPFELLHQMEYLLQDTLNKVIDVVTLQTKEIKEKPKVILLKDENKEVDL